jgi:hypothetical protein
VTGKGKSAGDGGRDAASRALVRLTVFATLLMVGGCSDFDRAYYTVTNSVQSAFYDLRHTKSASVRPVHTASQAPPGNYSDSPPARSPETPPSTPVVVDGLSAKAARSLLGQPAARGGPAPGETWTYRSGTCEVHLYLFPNVDHGGMQVLDHRVSGAGAGENAQQACLRRLRDGSSS